MQKYARIQGGIVAELIELADGADIAQFFTPAIASTMAKCGPQVQPGWTYDGVAFAEPAPLAPTTPNSVSMRQARLALLQVGKLADANQAVAAAGEAAMIEWEFSGTVSRASPLVVQMGAALGLDLDALFTLAAGL